MIYVFLTLSFVIMQSLFSGMETGLISLRKPRVDHGVRQGDRPAQLLDFFLKRPGFLLATTLLGTNICLVCASLMAEKAALNFGLDKNYSSLTAVVVMTILLLVAEIVPKNWFRQAPYERCRIFIYILYAFYIIMYLPILLLAKFTEKVSAVFSRANKNKPDPRILMREDFRLLLRESEAAGIIDGEGADILDKSLDFYTVKVGDIMVQRRNIREIAAHTSISDAMKFCKEYGISRAPVFLENTDDGGNRERWIGVFSVYDAIFNIPEKSGTA